jgi:type IV secretion system protein VirB9
VTVRFLLLAAVMAAPAHADPRITTHFYEPSSIVTLRGHAGIESTIAFAPDERIENIAVGNSATWQVTPNKRANLLFVKPVGARAHTNMTVITDQRTYLFDLVASTAAAPVYMLRFSYPMPPKAPAPVAVPIAEPAPVVAVAVPPQPTPADLNFAWSSRGDKKLLPARLFDDGRSTYLEWPKDATLPAILVRDASGLEGPVNSTIQGQYIVVEGVPAQLVLRQGKQLATLSPDPSPKHNDPAPPAPVSLGQVASARP